MLKRTTLLAAACLSVAAGTTLLSQAVADDVTKTTSSVTSDQPFLPDGITAKDLNSDKAVERAFKAVTEDAMSKTGFDNLVSRLVVQDKDRITKSLTSGSLNNINGSKNQKLTDVIASLDGAWQAKYNQKFSIDIAKVYTPDYIHIQTGEVADADLLVGKWPVAPTIMSGNAGNLTQSDADKAKAHMFGSDVKLEKGRNVAVAQFQTTQSFSGLNASMIHEAGGWKFDIPNTIDAHKLYDNVVNNLTALDNSRTSWPDDVNEGYRRFTQAVVAALYDAPYPGVPVRPTGAAMNR
jgi:hypothetical protein